MSFRVLKNEYNVYGTNKTRDLKTDNRSMYFTALQSGIRTDRIDERLRFKTEQNTYDLQYAGYDNASEQHQARINGGEPCWLEDPHPRALLDPSKLTGLGIRQIEKMKIYGVPLNNTRYLFPDP